MPLTDNTAQWGVRRLTKFQDNNGIPVGFEYFSTNPNIPAGSLPLFGGEYSRTVYADLWSWVQEQAGYLIEESEWQVKFSSNGGNVPFYSKGNGTTTFRVPSLKCWIKGANGIEEVGSYLSAGLPNITGGVGNLDVSEGAIYRGFAYPSSAFGAFKGVATGNTRWASIQAQDDSAITTLSFDASRSNPIYGASTTVQPKSIVGMWLVKAYGTVTNVGSTDIAAVLSGIANAETRLSELTDRTDVVAQGDGYIRYSNGLQICWGNEENINYGNPDVTFPLPFLNKNITVQVTTTDGSDFVPVSIARIISNTTFQYRTNVSSMVSGSWLAIGCWK